MSIQFLQAEKQLHDVLLFPAIELKVSPGKVAAISSSLNIREQLLKILLGKGKLSKGEIIKSERAGFLFLEEGYYERLSVKESLAFTSSIYNSSVPVEHAMRLLQIDDFQRKKLRELSFSERKRVQFANLFLQDADVYILEEPDQNLDLESKRLFITWMNELRTLHKPVLILTSGIEHAISYSDEVYRLDENGLHSVQLEETEEKEAQEIQIEEEAPIVQPIRFEKIPTKVNEKIVLFDPPEIDYIESTEGQTYLHIRGESFPCTFTLNELEERLLAFGFFRCHRSYIVNLQKVREVITWTRNSYSLVLEDTGKSSIPLSKTKMAELKGMLGLK